MINLVINKFLLVLQFNANGLKNHKNNLQRVLYDRRRDIVLITETHFTNYSKVFIPGYKPMKVNHRMHIIQYIIKLKALVVGQ